MEIFQIAQTKATNMCETLKFVQEQFEYKVELEIQKEHKEINRFTCIITKLKTHKLYHAYYKLREYEDLKVEIVLLNLHCETFNLQACELTQWWEEVHDMFGEDL
jgi:hypothetical protein